MRPVDKGANTTTYKRYGDAIGDLEKRLGAYCSYCELPFGALEVEHIQPKKLNTTLITEWSNFLLSCKVCNTIKGAQPTSLQGALWPDRDNTLLAINYLRRGWIEFPSGLSSDLRGKAETLVNLVKLDRHHLAIDRRKKLTKRDGRSRARDRIWELAIKWKLKIANWNASNRGEAVELIRDMAVGYGCFSVWMSVFADAQDVRLALIAAFPNTALDCFEADGTLKNRSGGRI